MTQTPTTAAAAQGSGRSPLGLKLRRLKLRWYRFSDPLLGPLRRRWQHSLATRVITTAVVVTMLMTTLVGAFILTTVGSDLTQSRLTAALNDSARATVAAQQVIDASADGDHGSLSTLMQSVRNTVRDTSSSSLIFVRRHPGQPSSAEAPADFRTGPGLREALTKELSEAIGDTAVPQVWQYVEFPGGAGERPSEPGVIVGTRLTFPSGAGVYDLFIGYSFAETEASLQFISRTLIAAGVILISFIAISTWAALTRVFRPVRDTAQISRRLAAGDKKARMAHQNDTHFDELADNFNEMADTLGARIDELDTLSTMQQRFVSDVSHELRTPLTTIRLASEVLSASTAESADPQQQAAKVLNEQVNRFEELLGDLLEISRYDAGRVQLEPEPVSIVDLTSTVISQLQPLSQSLIELRPLGGYNQVSVDPRRIRRILSNLIGNAIEHGEGKAIIVTVDSNTSALAVTVRDFGVGMTAAQTDRVFDRFWRADPARKRTLGGTGLGLAIAQEDAAVHGGLIDVWSRPGEGTNFRLTLPQRDGDNTFLSPLPLVPSGVDSAAAGDTLTTGWISRPRRWLLRRGADGADST